jgi:hypothetical protein
MSDNCGCLFEFNYEGKSYGFECDMPAGHTAEHMALTPDGDDILAIFFDAEHFLLDLKKFLKIKEMTDDTILSNTNDRMFCRSSDGSFCMYSSDPDVEHDPLYLSLYESYLETDARLSRNGIRREGQDAPAEAGPEPGKGPEEG